MNEQRIEQLRQEQQRLSIAYRTTEAQLNSLAGQLLQIEDQIRDLGSADSRAFVLASVEDRRRQAHAEQERERAERAAANAEWLQLQQQGETDAARAERERFQQNRIEQERQREEREERNRQNRIAELRARGVTVYE